MLFITICAQFKNLYQGIYKKRVENDNNFLKIPIVLLYWELENSAWNRLGKIQNIYILLWIFSLWILSLTRKKSRTLKIIYPNSYIEKNLMVINNITTLFVFFKCFRYPRDGAIEKISQKWIMKRCLELCGITMIRILYVKLLVKGNTNAKVNFPF